MENKKQIIEQLKSLKTDETKAIWMHQTIKQLEENFEETINRIEDRTAKLINDVLEQDLGLQKDIKRWADLGRRYEGFCERLKSRIWYEENVNEEALELLKQSKFTIQQLRSNIAKAKLSTSQTRKDMVEMKRKLYMHEQIYRLPTDAMKQKAKRLCEGNLPKYKITEIIESVKNER